MQLRIVQITITLPDEVEGDYSFILNFIEDKKNKAASTRYTNIDKFTLQIDFQNLDGSTHAGNTELVAIGTLKKKPLYWNYRITDLRNVGKTVLFNFYVGEGVNNG